jgi:5'-methylthioadenosine phosphorylase
MNERDAVAVIGGSRAHALLASKSRHFTRVGAVTTPFGLSTPLHKARVGDAAFLFLPRHGEAGHEVAAPWVNYRANIYGLKEQGVSRIMAWSGAVAIDAALQIGQYFLPSDLIDATHGRESSFYKGTGLGFIRQYPVFCQEMREFATRALDLLGVKRRDFGTYVCTQGPRMETAAEIRRVRSWGGDVVGMTLAPEAFLARELEICYLPICYISGHAEGVHERQSRPGESFEGLVEEAEEDAVGEAIERFLDVAASLARNLPSERTCPCALTMERYRREKRIEDDWHTWIGKP